jgi:hypothetical protein
LKKFSYFIKNLTIVVAKRTRIIGKTVNDRPWDKVIIFFGELIAG